MKDEGRHIETWQGECQAEVKMKSEAGRMTVRDRGMAQHFGAERRFRCRQSNRCSYQTLLV